MKVLHLLTSNRFSGAENVACFIIGLFKNDKEKEMVYCCVDGQIKNTLEEKQIDYILMPSFNTTLVKKIIKKTQPDIVHAHDMRASYVASRCLGRAKLISHIHNNAYNSRKLSLKSIGYLFAAFKAKHIFWVSNSSYDGFLFHKWFKKKSSVLYNVVDSTELYRRKDLDKKTYNYDVIFIGRITYQKDPLRFLDICSLLRNQKRNIRIAVVGTGDMEGEFLKKVEKEKLSKNIDYLGFISNPLKILHSSKVMVLTSLWEGTPMVVLEAMSLGVPIVSTPVDGVLDLIKDGVDGFLSNDNDTIAKRVLDIVNEPSLRKKLSEKAIKEANDICDKEKYKREIELVYDSCKQTN